MSVHQKHRMNKPNTALFISKTSIFKHSDKKLFFKHDFFFKLLWLCDSEKVNRHVLVWLKPTSDRGSLCVEITLILRMLKWFAACLVLLLSYRKKKPVQTSNIHVAFFRSVWMPMLNVTVHADKAYEQK